MAEKGRDLAKTKNKVKLAEPQPLPSIRSTQTKPRKRPCNDACKTVTLSGVSVTGREPVNYDR